MGRAQGCGGHSPVARSGSSELRSEPPVVIPWAVQREAVHCGHGIRSLSAPGSASHHYMLRSIRYDNWRYVGRVKAGHGPGGPDSVSNVRVGSACFREIDSRDRFLFLNTA